MLFFCSITIMAQAQQKFEISGIVQDETGQPVPGVSVYVKDKTGIGTNTDMDGKFVLKVDRGDKVQFSFIGYARHEYLALKTEKKLVIQLVPDVSALDEVVVEAYGSKTRKITTTGAVTSVDVLWHYSSYLCKPIAPGECTVQRKRNIKNSAMPFAERTLI